jgi:predicted anti-sigma-YlaC factor YlaD
MLNCKQVTVVCSLEMDRPLSLSQQVSMHTHLMMCTGCRNYRKHLKTMRQVMQAYAEGKAPADELDCGARK